MEKVAMTTSRSAERDKDAFHKPEIQFSDVYKRIKESRAQQELGQNSGVPRTRPVQNGAKHSSERAMGRQLLGITTGSHCSILGEFNGRKTERRVGKPELERSEGKLWKCNGMDEPELELKEKLRLNAMKINDLLYNKSPFSPRNVAKDVGVNENGPRKIKDDYKHGGVNENGPRKIDDDYKHGGNRDGNLTTSTKHSNGSSDSVVQRIFDLSERDGNSNPISDSSSCRRTAECSSVSRMHYDGTRSLFLTSPLVSPVSQADSAIGMESESPQLEIVSENRYGNHLTSDYSQNLCHMHSCCTMSMNEGTSEGSPELSAPGLRGQWKDGSSLGSKCPSLSSLPNFVGNGAIRSLLSLHKDQLSEDESDKKRELLGGIHKTTHESPKSRKPLAQSSEDPDDSVDDTDPSLESCHRHLSPITPNPRIHPRRNFNYIVKNHRASPKPGKSVSDMRYSSSFDQSERGSRVTDIREAGQRYALKSRSYGDIYDKGTTNGVDSFDQNGGDLQNPSPDCVKDKYRTATDCLQDKCTSFTDSVQDKYSSSTDCPVNDSRSYMSFNNFTLSSRTGRDVDTFTVVMDPIGETKTDVSFDDDADQQQVDASPDGDVTRRQCTRPDGDVTRHQLTSSLDGDVNRCQLTSSLDENVYSVIADPVTVDAANSQITKDDSNRDDVKTFQSVSVSSRESESNRQTSDMASKDSHHCRSHRQAGGIQSKQSSSEDSTHSDGGATYPMRNLDSSDAEFFMETEYLDSVMKPKVSRFRKFFTGKKGKYSPATQSPQSPTRSSQSQSPRCPQHQSSRSQSIPENVTMLKSILKSQEKYVQKDRFSGAPGRVESSAIHADVRSWRQDVDRDGVPGTGNRFDFSAAGTPDHSCAVSLSGRKLGGRQMDASEDFLTFGKKSTDVINESACPSRSALMISTGNGPCIEHGDMDTIDPWDASTPEVSKGSREKCFENRVEGSSSESDSLPRPNWSQDGGTMLKNAEVLCSDNDLCDSIDNLSDPFSDPEHVTEECVAEDAGSTVHEPSRKVSSQDDNRTFVSEGFEYQNSFENRFLGSSLNESGSSVGNNPSASPRSAWSEIHDTDEVENSFDNDFSESFNSSSWINGNGHIKDGGKDLKDPEQTAVPQFDGEDVDRIFDLAKDPPTFGDVCDEWPEFHEEYAASFDSEMMEEIPEEGENIIESPTTESSNSTDVATIATENAEPSNFADEFAIPKPVACQLSPQMSSKRSRLTKQTSLCSNDDSVDLDASNPEINPTGVSSESDVIRSAFDFLGSSSDAEAVTTMRQRLMMLEEEDSEEDVDLASSFKILSDLRKSLAGGICFEPDDVEDGPDLPDEETRTAAVAEVVVVSDDEDSSFQLDPRPAGVVVEIKVDVHQVESSDNCSELDVPVTTLDDDVLTGATMMTVPHDGAADDDDDYEAITPRLQESLNSTCCASVERDDGKEVKDTSKKLSNDLKLSLDWLDEQPSSAVSTYRGDNSLDDSGSSSEPSASFQSRPVLRTRAKPCPSSADGNRDVDSFSELLKADGTGLAGSHRYIKKNEMEKKKMLLRCQQMTVDDDEMLPGDGFESLDESVLTEYDSVDVNIDENVDRGQMNETYTVESGRESGKELSHDNPSKHNGVLPGRHKDSLIQSLLPSSRGLSHIPDAAVNLSNEFNVSFSSDDVVFDDLNNKSVGNVNNGVSRSIFSPRARAYRKSSDESSMMSEDSTPRKEFSREHTYDVPNVIPNPSVAMSTGTIVDQTPDSTDDSNFVSILEKPEPHYSDLTEQSELPALSTASDGASESLDPNSRQQFVSPYATSGILISDVPDSQRPPNPTDCPSKQTGAVCNPYATIDIHAHDPSVHVGRRLSCDSSPYATVLDCDSHLCDCGVSDCACDVDDSVTSPTLLEDSLGYLSPQSLTSVTCRQRTFPGMCIPEIEIHGPTEDETEDDEIPERKPRKSPNKVQHREDHTMELYCKVMKQRSNGNNLAERIRNQSPPDEDDEVLGACGGCEELCNAGDDGPPIPYRKYLRSVSSHSPLHPQQGLNTKPRASIFSDFKGRMRRALSMDRGLDEVRNKDEKRSGKKDKKERAKEKNAEKERSKERKSEGKLSKATSLKSLSALFGRKNKHRLSPVEIDVEPVEETEKKVKKERGFFKSKKKHKVSITIETVETPTHFRCIGKLREVNPDGTKLVELLKPVDGPIGFYIAKGTVNYDYGIIVSRFSDNQQKLFAGILDVGDEILEINDHPLKDLSLNDVYAIMAETETLFLKVFPLVARKEV